MSGRSDIIKPIISAAAHALEEHNLGDLVKTSTSAVRGLRGSGEVEAAAASKSLATESLERIARPAQVKVVAPNASDFEDWHKLFDQYGNGVSREISQAVWSDIHGSNPGFNALLAKTNDEQTVGFIHFYGVPHLPSGSVQGYAENFYVDPAARKMGAPGLKLMAKLFEEGEKRGWTSVHWITNEDNERARTIYDHIAKPSQSRMYDIKADIFNRPLPDGSEHSFEKGKTALRTTPLAEADRPAWEQLFQQHVTESKGSTISKDVLETSWKWLQDSRNNMQGLITKTESGEPIGFAHLRGYPRPLYAMNGGRLDDLFVSPSFRQQGAGKDLTIAAVHESRTRGWLGVRWEAPTANTAAIAFSDKIAYQLPRAIYEAPLTGSNKVANRFLIGR